VVGGNFTLPTAAITQLRPNATVDTSFNPGAGADGPVHWVSVLPDDRTLIAGAFSLVDGNTDTRVARLSRDGTVDPSFFANVISNGTVYCLAAQSDGKVVLGGDFVLNTSTNTYHLLRLNGDGSLDTGFRMGAGPNASVFALGLQAQGQILIGGDFTAFNGTNRARLARLNADGSLDLSFEPGSGANSTIFALAIQPNGAIVIGGDFTVVNGVPRNRVARVFGSVPPLRVTSISLVGGQALVTISSVPGLTYFLEGSTDLNTWSVVDVRMATGESLTLVDPGAGGLLYRFYRVTTNAR
jgi:uncharacterized delta-60 repeat protein